MLIIEQPAILLASFFVLLLSVGECSQFLVPVGLQRIRNQSVFRIDPHVAALRQFRFIASTLDMLASQAIRFIEARLQFLLHGERDFQSDRIHQFQQDIADDSINVGARDALAERFGIFDAFALTDVLRAQAFAPRMVAKRHSAAAFAADDQALQQRRTFARRTFPTIKSDSLCAFPQALQVSFMFVPANVGRV